MHFLTPNECRAWVGHNSVSCGVNGTPLPPHTERNHARAQVPHAFTELLGLCRQLEQALQPRHTCLLWVTESEIWFSQANWHLYYRLRQSYRDHRLLDDAPGHLFLNFEAAELVTFVHVAALCGFDAHLITDSTGYSRAFLSHDEFVEFSANDANPGLVRDFVSAVGGAAAGVNPSSPKP